MHTNHIGLKIIDIGKHNIKTHVMWYYSSENGRQSKREQMQGVCGITKRKDKEEKNYIEELDVSFNGIGF